MWACGLSWLAHFLDDGLFAIGVDGSAAVLPFDSLMTELLIHVSDVAIVFD